MSFSFYATGSPAAVRAECDKRHDHESPHAIAVKECIKGLLDGAPAGSVVSVESGGHHDYGGHYTAGTVDFRFRLAKPLPEPESIPPAIAQD